MLIHLAATTFDLDGAFTLRVLPASDFGETRRRMNRIATLDGAAVFNDFGATDGDRTIRLQWAPMSAANEALAARLVRMYSRLRLSCPSGLYLVAPESYKASPNQSVMTLLVVENLTA
jgi:hypothetical protein